MDARKKINQKRRQGGGGRNRQQGGGRKKGGAGRVGGGRGGGGGGLGGKKKLNRSGLSTKKVAGNRSPVKTKLRRTAKGLVKVIPGNKPNKPIRDLRQLIKGKQSPKVKQSAIKKRLGLQSSSSRARSVKLNRGSLRMDVDGGGRAGKTKTRVWRRSTTVTEAPPVPTVIIASGPATAAPTIVSGAGPSRRVGHSIIISNLSPSVTQADIMELFGDIGQISSFQTINSTTAMVTYNSTNDASRAIQTYNNRLLDGLPMQVTLIPTPGASSPTKSGVSQVFRRVFST